MCARFTYYRTRELIPFALNEGSLKNAKVVGMKIIWDFKRVGDKWEEGKILDPGNISTYSSSLWLVDTLKVRGYLGPFYRSQIWKRAKG